MTVLHPGPPDCTSGETVEWMNGGEEQGKPYDLCVRQSDGDREITALIEVKATRSADRCYLEVRRVSCTEAF